jgi:hypothetical protein
MHSNNEALYGVPSGLCYISALVVGTLGFPAMTVGVIFAGIVLHTVALQRR